jgi:hypothetical protein
MPRPPQKNEIDPDEEIVTAEVVEVVEDDDTQIYEQEPLPRKTSTQRPRAGDDEEVDEPTISRKTASRPTRMRDRDDDSDDEDEDEERPRRRRHKRRSASAASKWHKGVIGLLLVFISACILGGGFGIQELIHLILTVSSASSSGLGTIVQIAHFLIFASAIVAIVGYVFCMMVPNKNGTLGLAIAAICLGGVNLIFHLQYHLLPMFDKSLWGGAFMATGGLNVGRMVFFDLTGALIMELIAKLSFDAELIIVAIYLRTVSLSFKDYQGAQNSMVVVSLGAVHAGLQLILYILMLASLGQPRVRMAPTAPDAGPGAIYYIGQILLWGAVVVFLIELVFYALTIFSTRDSIEY